MKTKYHIQITQKVLEEYFDQNAIDKIIKANIWQDRIKNQIGHDYIHFDGSAFSEGFAYIQTQESILYNAIEDYDYSEAWAATGRLLHSWQDFYSHSNYVQLWHQITENPSPEEIDHNDPEIFNAPKLKSGKNYGIIEFFAMIPGLSRLIKPLMPADSHAKMNLDSPKSGPYFEFAFIAAQKRTKQAINAILRQLFTLDIKGEAIHVFLGK